DPNARPGISVSIAGLEPRLSHIHAVRTSRSPSPQPSPRRRGSLFRPRWKPSQNADILLQCEMVLPLPWGEGWGEGERRVQLHRTAGARPPNPGTSPAVLILPAQGPLD